MKVFKHIKQGWLIWDEENSMGYTINIRYRKFPMWEAPKNKDWLISCPLALLVETGKTVDGVIEEVDREYEAAIERIEKGKWLALQEKNKIEAMVQRDKQRLETIWNSWK